MVVAALLIKLAAEWPKVLNAPIAATATSNMINAYSINP